MVIESKKQQLIKKGFGLVEVLIALLLVGSTMIMSIQIVAKGLRASKNNEIRDTAAGIMLRALEYNQIDLPDMPASTDFSSKTTAQSVCFKLDKKSSDTDEIQISNSITCDGYYPIDTCDLNSPYRLVNTPGIDICNQVMFTNLKANADITNWVEVMDGTKIRITSTVVYLIDGQEVIERVDTYRRI